MALWLGSQEILRRHILSIDDIMSIIDAISADEVTTVAEKLLNTKQLNLAIVGPIRKEEALLESLRI
jgi:predicted Zn-dependent peptidase